MRVVVVGGGVSGMLASLLLARDGHAVTVVERDLTDLPSTPDEAFDHWDRTGAPHARQSHALLARLRNILRSEVPDVLQSLYDWGTTELTVERLLPPTIADRQPRAGDDDLVLLAGRRLTLEWALRRACTAEPGLTWRGGSGVERLMANGTNVAGVVLEDGSTIAGDFVVVAGGRRSPIMSWIAGLGGTTQPTEDLHECEIIYYSRFYRLAGGVAEMPVLGGMSAGGDLGYVKFGGFYGDNRTFSITLASPTDDVEMRKLSRVPQFEAAVRTFPVFEPWVADGLAAPISGVASMARLRNRVRRFVVDGQPVATGIGVIGDAAICTNPLYGKGCALGGVGAIALRDVLRAHTDLRDIAAALHQRMTDDVEPHYETSRRQDTDVQKVRAASLGKAEPDPTSTMIRDFVLNGLIPATRTDPDVFRAFFRSFNLLSPADALMNDTAVISAAQQAYAARDQRPPVPPLGPEREEMVAILAAAG